MVFGFFVVIGCSAALIALLYAILRFAAARSDRIGRKPEEMVHELEDSPGSRSYQVMAGITNSYLLPCEGGYLLVDTGYPWDYQRFKSALAFVGIAVGEIKHLFLSHAHDDHAGFAAALAGETDCRIIVPEASLAQLAAGKPALEGRAITRRIQVMSSLYGLVTRRTMIFPPVNLGAGDVIIKGEDRDAARSIGIAGSFIPSPGHTADSFSLLLDDGSCFCADAAMNYLNFLGADSRPIFVADEAQAYRSLRSLLARGAKRFYVSHGESMGSAEVEAMLARHAATDESPAVVSLRAS